MGTGNELLACVQFFEDKYSCLKKKNNIGVFSLASSQACLQQLK